MTYEKPQAEVMEFDFDAFNVVAKPKSIIFAVAFIIFKFFLSSSELKVTKILSNFRSR